MIATVDRPPARQPRPDPLAPDRERRASSPLSLLGGLAYAFQFNHLYPFAGVEWLSPGRVRMVHTNMAAYGFIANAFIAGMLFAIPRLTRRPILSDRLGWLIFVAWQLIMVLTIVGQLGRLRPGDRVGRDADLRRSADPGRARAAGRSTSRRRSSRPPSTGST